MQGCREASREERTPRKDRLGAQRGQSVIGPTAPTHGERPRLAPTASSVRKRPGTSVRCLRAPEAPEACRAEGAASCCGHRAHG